MHRLTVLVLFFAPLLATAGLHYSGESFAELPSRWRGFLLDQRLLRQVGIAPPKGTAEGSLRARYLVEAARLGKKASPSADELADLGALYLRLGETTRALDLLRSAVRSHPVHYRLWSNLGTAWQLSGNLSQAAAALEQAVRLAPGKYVKAEELQLRLVRQRLRQPAGTASLDDLFGVQWIGPSGKFEPGRLDAAEQKKLPASAIASLQQLALWLPADARLLGQLAELANAHGDVTTAAAILDGCVTEFGLRDPTLQDHRKLTRAAADEQAKKKGDGKEEHSAHALLFKPRSSRPLENKLSGPLPVIDPKGINHLPWEVVAETTLDRQLRPTFPKYLRELEGKQVVLRGFMQPLGEDTDLGAFLLIEHPVGCWFCEVPEVTNIVLIELPTGKAGRFTRDRIRVSGTLKLNTTDPENFLYTLADAKMSDATGE